MQKWVQYTEVSIICSRWCNILWLASYAAGAKWNEKREEFYEEISEFDSRFPVSRSAGRLRPGTGGY